MEERRRFPRFDMNVNVKWDKIADVPESNVSDVDVTKNISSGGICLIVYERLAEGDRLNMEIELPTRKIIRAAGKVVWIHEFELIGKSSEKRYDVGVEFLDLKDEEREEIKNFLFSFIKKREGKGR